MKKHVYVLALACLMTTAANAQSTTNKTAPPKTATSGAPTSTATNTAPKTATSTATNWTPAACAAQIPPLKAAATKCLAVSDFNQRAACFQQAGNAFPNGFFQSCSAVTEPLKQSIVAQEHAKYPKQASAIDAGGGGNNNNGGNQSNNNGPNGQMNGQNGNMPGGPNNGQMNGQMNGQSNGQNNGQMNSQNGNMNNGNNNGNQVPYFDPSKCSAQFPKITAAADKCITVSDFNSRAACFSQVGNGFPPGFFEACQTAMAPIKQTYLNKEKSLYPNQASAVDGNNNNGGNQSNNGPNGQMNGQNGNMQGGPNNGQMNGQNGNMQGGPNNGQMNGQNGNMNGNQNFVAWPQATCDKSLPVVKAAADHCLNVKNYDRRLTCINNIPKKLPAGFGDGCRASLSSLQADYAAKEHTKYPTQGSAVMASGGGNNGGGNQSNNNGPNGGNNNGNNGGNNNGNNNGGNQTAAYDPSKCSAQFPKITATADKCITISSFSSRAACFSQIGNGFPAGYFEACQSALAPIKQTYLDKEKALYPDQASAVDGNNNNGGGNQANNNNSKPTTTANTNHSPATVSAAPKIQCTTFVAGIDKSATACVAIKDQKKRKACFDTIGNTISKSPAQDQCSDALNGLKSKYQAKESEMYPGAPASID